MEDLKKSIERIEKLEKLQVKRSELLSELKRSMIYESKKYHLFPDEKTEFQRFYLYDIKTGKELIYGPLARVKSYMNIRNFDMNDVMNDTKIEL